MRQDVPGVVGAGGRVAVLGAVEGCKGVADAALLTAARAVASIWQKLAYQHNGVKKCQVQHCIHVSLKPPHILYMKIINWLCTTKQLHKTYGLDINLYPAPTGTTGTTKQFAATQ